MLTQHAMAFVTAGAIWQDMEVRPDVGGGISKTMSGYVVGGGMEYELMRNFNLRLEYLYSAYDATKFDAAPGIHERFDPETHQVRLGLIIPLALH